MLKRVLLLTCLLAGTLAAAGSFQEIQSRVSSFTLKNGMTFIVMERHQTPVATFLTYADVGSVQEVKGITGLAHIFEHMAFKGSPTLGGRNDYGYPRDFLQRFQEGIRKVTKADVERVARLYMKSDQFAILVLGKEKDFEAPLASLGKVTRIDITIAK